MTLAGGPHVVVHQKYPISMHVFSNNPIKLHF